MASASDKLKDKDFQNWLKAALGISIVKKGIETYVSSVIENFHLEVLKKILSVEEVDKSALCSSCTNEILKDKFKKCPKNICHNVRDAIINAHWYRKPSWKNTQVENWCKNHWEIAKCYMPPDGYIEVNSSSETDLNGIVSVMMNHMEFMADKTDVKKDICEKTRKATKAVRHSADLTMNDVDFNSHIETLINFLEIYKDSSPTAVEAQEKLKKLKEETLKITTNELTELLTNYVREEIQDGKRNALNEIEQKRNQILRALIDEINKHHSAKYASFDDFLNRKLKDVFDEIDKKKASAIDDICRQNNKNDTLKQEFYHDLLIFNKQFYSTIPLSPLFEKEDMPFEETYVQPNMKIVEHQFRKSLREDIKTDITCLSNIFTRTLKNNIYVISDAGLGKTVFCKRLIMAWCLAHDKEKSEKGIEKQEDLKLMQDFDYAFLLPLRASCDTDCDIDEMISHQVIPNLARSKRYTPDFLQDILTNDRCLIILDGLDEWTHPKGKHCKTKNDIPHRKAREHCTILTTTRPWKFYSLSLSINEIDRLVEITGLDYNAADKLVDNIVSIFGDVDVEQRKRDKEDFRQKMRKESITEVKNVPLILIHLMCLWYKKLPFGNSYCEIFSNIIGLYIERAGVKLKTNDWSSPGPKRRKIWLPKCIAKNTVCRASHELLKLLANLAFVTYFNRNKENSLVFSEDQAKTMLQNTYFDSCMANGLLTTQGKSKEHRKDNAPRVSFAHKTFQEFFAALHIFFENDVKRAERKLSDICNTVYEILSLTNFLLFLHGMCPEKAKLLYPAFLKIMTTSETVKGYRKDFGSWNYFVGYSETIKRLQTLFVNCVKEGIENEQIHVQVSFEDIIIDSEFQVGYSNILKRIIEENGRDVKSVKFRDLKTQIEFQQIVELFRKSKTCALEKIDVKCEISNESLELLLKDTEHSLKCFVIKGGHWLGMKWCNEHVRLSYKCLQFICTMGQLQDLYLRTIEVSHDQLVQLFDFITRSRNMKQIGLGFLKCLQHNDSCKDLGLDLAYNSQLQLLEIGSVPVSRVKVNTESLELCYVGSFKESSVLYDILETLSHAPKLQVFCCGFLNSHKDIQRMLETLAVLKMLQHIYLIYMELSDEEFRLSNEMKDIKELFLQNCKMTVGTLQKIMQHVTALELHLIIGLLECTVDPREDLEREIQHIKATQGIHVIQDEMKGNQRRDFIFKT